MSTTTTERPSMPVGPPPGRVADLLHLRAQGSLRAAYIHGSSGAVLHWHEAAHGVRRWEANREQLTEGGTRCVGLLLDDPLVTAACFLGALGAGVGVAPLNPDASPSELAAQCRALGVAAVVTDVDDPSVTDRLRDAGCELWDPAGDTLRRRSSRSGPPPPAPPGPAALVLSSSGTTGTPKIVALDEGQLLHTARNVAAHHELSTNDRGYCPLPLFHINALVVGVLSAVVAGSSLVVDRRFSRRAFWPTVAEQQVTWLNLVPAIMRALVDAPAEPLGTPIGVRFARSASSPLPPTTLERFEARFGISVLETYGMTEAASQITANPLWAADRRPGSVGRAVGVEVRIAGPDRRDLPAGATGDVEIRGRSVVTSYWPPAAVGAVPRPAAEDGWLKTGDLGYLDRDGFLYLVGRSDDVINRGGEKIYPREIENVLLADPRVVSAVVVGRPHPIVGQEPVAFVLAKVGPEQRTGLVAELHDRCDAELSRYKRPVLITVADTLPVGPTGKVRRSAVQTLVTGTPQVPVADLDLPPRSSKPRTTGMTMVIDNGMPTGAFEDAITSAAAYVDVVKFGWGTALVTKDLERKIDCLRANGVRFSFGGTLFEKFAMQNRFESFLTFCHHFGCDFVEVSNGTIPLTNTAKAAFVRRCAQEFTVVSEVGVKDPRRSEDLDARSWIDAIVEDLDAGAAYVITEARESGRSGICRADGELRTDIVDDILASGIDTDRLMFEAPTKVLQTEFIKRFGPEVNLGNIGAADVLGLETLRLGLRSDTFMHFETVGLHA